MVLRALEKYGDMTTKELALTLGIPEENIDYEIGRLQRLNKVCTDRHGKHYIPPKTTFATWLLVCLLLFICSWVLIGAIGGGVN